MKYLRKFNESKFDIEELLEDYLLEYIDKYQLIEKDKYFELNTDSDHWKKSQYKGLYSIVNQVSTNYLFHPGPGYRPKRDTSYFKVAGFPNKKSGYLVTISFFYRPTKDIEKEFNKDMISFINRFCNSKDDKTFNVETSFSDVFGNGTVFDYYIAFFK